MTITGAKQLEAELQRLKTIERQKTIQAIAEARSHGDISENAEYDAAKEKQAFIEAKIADIEAKLSQAQIIDPSTIEHDGRVIFGVTVKLFDVEQEHEVTYQIVGEDEADLRMGKISINSPVARGLIGRESGSTVEIRTPNGIKEYEILDFYL